MCNFISCCAAVLVSFQESTSEKCVWLLKCCLGWSPGALGSCNVFAAMTVEGGLALGFKEDMHDRLAAFALLQRNILGWFA